MEAPYLRIVDELRRRIASGRLRPGDRIPSTRQIAKDWGVAIATATKALAALRQEGLVRGVAGVGTVVATPEPAAAPRRAPRRTEPELTRDRVVRAAVELGDAEGLAAVSMRRLATELGTATMTLYRYVPNKHELIRLMTDAIFAEAPLPASPPKGWRAQLEVVARLQWTLSRAHPWMSGVISLTRPPLAPNAMAHTEWTLRTLAQMGFDPATGLHLALSLVCFIQGLGVNLASEVDARQDSGVSADEWMAGVERDFVALASTGRYPRLAEAAAVPGLDPQLDAVFETGLRVFLDGLEAYRSRRPARASGAGEAARA